MPPHPPTMPPHAYARRTIIQVPADALRRWHLTPEATARLTPPWGSHDTGFRELCNGATQDGAPPAPEGWTFERCFEPLGTARSALVDEVGFRPLRRRGGRKMKAHAVRTALDRLFTYRHAVAKGDLESQARATTPTPLHILVTGSSGLIGSALVPYLRTAGHEVTCLVRTEGPAPGAWWNPDADDLHFDPTTSLDAVVHLAGENIAGRRWRPAQKRRILESRVRGTQRLARGLAELRPPPRVLVSASATGFYGDGGDDLLDETHPRGTGFLADVAAAWEDATRPARAAGIRVVHLRFGMVLSPAGGALPRLLGPARLGLGGPLGSGNAFWPWIALDDAVSGVLHALAHETLEGPVNAVTPEAVRQRDFAKTLGRVLQRPAFLPTPAFALKGALGEMAPALLLASQRVPPLRLLQAGYRFRHPGLEDALRHLLGRPRSASTRTPLEAP